MICNPSDSVRFDKSREHNFFVWEPGAPEAILISARWDASWRGGSWRAWKTGDTGTGSSGSSPFDAAVSVCIAANICIDEIATEAVILREIEATRTERDAAVSACTFANVSCANMKKERDKALDDLGAAITRCSGALAAHETEVKAHQHTAAERDLAVQRCDELTKELEWTRGERGKAMDKFDLAERDLAAARRDIEALREDLNDARKERDTARQDCAEANRQFKEFKKLRPNAAVLLSLQDEVDALTKQRERLLRERETAVHERNEALDKLNAMTADRDAWQGLRDMVVAECDAAIQARDTMERERDAAVVRMVNAVKQRDTEIVAKADALGKLDAMTDDRDAWQAAARIATETRDSAVKSRDEMTRERDNAVKSAVEAQRREREADGARVIAQREVVDMERERDTALCELEEARAELHRARELTRNAGAELGSATREFARSMESMRAELSAMTRMRDEAGETLAIAVQERERADDGRQDATRAHDRLDLLILKILNAKSDGGPEINPERVNLLRELAVSAGYAATAEWLTRIYTELDVLRADRETLKVHAAVADGSLANAKETIAAQTKTIEDQSDKIRRVTDLADAQLVNAVSILQTSLATVTSERDGALARLKKMTESYDRVLAERDTMRWTLTEAAREAINQRNEAIKQRDAMTDARNAQWNATKEVIAERDAAKAELAVAVEELARQHITEKELRAALEQRPVAAQVRYVEAHAVVCEELAQRLDAIGRHSQASAVRSCVEIHNARHILLGMVTLEVPSRFFEIIGNIYNRETWNAARGLMLTDQDAPTGDPWEYVEHLARRQGVKISNPSR